VARKQTVLTVSIGSEVRAIDLDSISADLQACANRITDFCQIDVDHINGNANDNRPINLQVICKCCHALKTKVQKDMVKRK
jgi:hypothetical protein